MSAYYDTIAKPYQRSKQLPYRQVEEYTYFNLLGPLEGKTILDLGCGEGFYTRKFKQRGASRVLGVDISSAMIELAKAQERENPLGIDYLVADVLELASLDRFDLVVASYLLNYAQTQGQLLQMCRVIFDHLKSDGRFVTINDNSEQDPISYQDCAKYGYIKGVTQPLEEGTPITLTFFLEGETFEIVNYHLSRTTYERAFRTVGFKAVRWLQPLVPPTAIATFGAHFWDDFLKFSPIVGIECLKTLRRGDRHSI
ncbi:class I SAM-dependent methyltransferase [Oxynema sp. CENA135]|uniref:class I SAM-dependent DNA methyltransferase n=1 Tax=Oxynema sp. CENA135 TaxID=984206 RepID=UPI00190A9391|nr:class I SAM-dependent methyltransferase [Oxynema sp. CENA135]MBK4730010.1 class I SAM-dependent methyltransferase [Oxynema sp. CENA135]